MNVGMHEKLVYNFNQKYVQILDTKSNIEQKDSEKQPPFVSDLLSQLFALIEPSCKIGNTNPNPLEYQELFDKLGLQSEANYLLETVSINNCPNDKKIDSTKVETIEAYLERELLSNHSALNNNYQSKNILDTDELQLKYLSNLTFYNDAKSINENESSRTDLANGLPKIVQSNQQEDAISIKFHYLGKKENIGNLLPDYQQSINQFASKTIPKQNQTKNAKIKMQIDNNFDGTNQGPSEAGLPLYEIANHFEDFSKLSPHSSEVNKNPSNIRQGDTFQFIPKQTSNVEPSKIENDKTLETMNKIREDTFSQKYKIQQTDNGILNYSTKGKETKNWEFLSQFIKNQSLTKPSLEHPNNSASELPTTFRLLSRYYEIPAKIASILNSRVELPARAEIRLQPRSLGMVVVVITASRNSVDITMQVKDQEIWKVLETQIAPLREKLNQLGFEKTNIDLRLSQWANSQMQNQAENKTEDYLFRRNFLRSFAQRRRNEVQDFQEFVSNIMGVS